MRELDCKEEKKRFLKAYKCYDAGAMDSLAEVIHIMPAPDFPAYDETPTRFWNLQSEKLSKNVLYRPENQRE